MIRAGRLRAVLILVVAGAAGCGSAEEPGPADAREPRPALLTVAPPVMGGAEAALTERVQARYASLEAARERRDTSSAELAAAFGEVGKLLIAAELLSQAEPYLANAATLAPRDMAWPYYLGHLHRLRNERETAIGFFEQALRLQPDAVPALVWLGALHLDRGDAAAARPPFEKALALQPGSAAARFGLGRAAIATGDHARAAEHLEKALAADPRATRAHYPLALAYRALGDAKRADFHLRQWQSAFAPAESLGDAQVYPSDPLMEEIGSLLQTAVAFEMRGTRALDERRWDEAIAQFRGGLNVAPRDATLHQNLGTALYLAGDETGAFAEFEQALQLSPGYARAHFSLGVLLEARGQDQSAIERFSAAVKFDPALVDARFRLAEALRRAGRVEESLGHYQSILSGDPRASQARFGHAMGLVRLRRYGEARAALEEAVRVHPDQPGFHHALARVLAAAPADQVRNGQRSLAIVDTLRKEFGDTLGLTETHAMALAETGRYGEAAARQRDAIAAAEAQGRADLASFLQEALRAYEAAMPWRTPWRDDDPVHLPPRASGLRL